MEKNIAIEASEFLPKIFADIDQRHPITSSFLFLMLILRLVFKIPLPDILFILVSFLLLFSLPIYLLIDKVKEKSPRRAINYYFGYLLFDLLLLTLIINFVGGIAWIIPTIYLFYIITFFWLFPWFQAIFLVLWANLLFILLVLVTYFGILPHFDIFLTEEKNPQNFPFVLTSTIIALTIIVFLGYSSDAFYRLLDKKIKELRRKGKELVSTKKFLEAEVGKRTKELQEERKKMAKLVEEKTRELKERRKIVEAKVEDLEKFHKMAVSRELKMAEIKEKIEKLKELQSKQ